MDDLNIYTGKISYRDIDFEFIFDKKELRLIPPDDKKSMIEWEWLKKKIREGVYTFADPLTLDRDYLIGQCNETGHGIVFIAERETYIGSRNTSLYFYPNAYIIFKYDRPLIDKISFSAPEINYIHPTNQAFQISFNIEELSEKGLLSLDTNSFDQTTTKCETFVVDGKNVEVYFGISWKQSFNVNKPPLQFESTLDFMFEQTDDYMFVIRLWRIARSFIRYLCYRKNIDFTEVQLSAPYEDGKHENFAALYLTDERKEYEEKALSEKRIIRYELIAGHMGGILSDIASNNLYLRHIPGSYADGNSITEARFVMITAAFEWEFKRLYPYGIRKSKDLLDAEREVKTVIEQHIKESAGNCKQIYKRLKRNIKSNPLEIRIEHAGKELGNIVDPFGIRLYKINNEVLSYTEMGNRLATQRNNYAHGDLSKEFVGLTLLDLIYIQYIIYAMQLKYYKVDDQKIQKAINELFHLNFAL